MGRMWCNLPFYKRLITVKGHDTVILSKANFDGLHFIPCGFRQTVDSGNQSVLWHNIVYIFQTHGIVDHILQCLCICGFRGIFQHNGCFRLFRIIGVKKNFSDPSFDLP